MAKAIKKQALGRGLSVILKEATNDLSQMDSKTAKLGIGSVAEIPIVYIKVNPFQPRSQFKDEALLELASSINQFGIIQPITVRKIKPDEFQLLSGERRFRASKILGLKTIPAYIRLANDQEALEMALVENIQRKDLDAIEIAMSFQRLINELKLTQDQISQRVGKKRSTIANYLRLLKLDPIIQTGIRDGFIGMGHGRAMVNIRSLQEQLFVYEEVISKKLSVRSTEKFIRRRSNPKLKTSKKTTEIPAFVKNDLNKISDFFSQSVKVKMGKNNDGMIGIPFYSKQDYRRIIKLLKGDS